jgi:hypothetical protein
MKENSCKEFWQAILPIWESLHNFCLNRRIFWSLLNRLSGGYRADGMYIHIQINK